MCGWSSAGGLANKQLKEESGGHKWRTLSIAVKQLVVTIPDELEKNGQPQNEKMKFESSKHETKLSMKLTAQVQARILSKTHRV